MNWKVNSLLKVFLIAALAFGMIPRNAMGQGASCGATGICGGNITTNGDAVILPLQPNTATVGIAISGTWTGTLSFRASANGGTTYVAATATDGTTTSVTTNPTTTLRFAVSGLTNFEVVATASMTGTAAIRINASTGSATDGGGVMEKVLPRGD